MDTHESDLLMKLEKIKEIRAMSVQLEKVRDKLRCEFEATETEERCLQEYKTEMELLQQEKMAHVEELRLIHADINLMESTIKQAEEDRHKALINAKHLFEEHGVLRDQLNILRSSIGLHPLTPTSTGALTDTDEGADVTDVEKFSCEFFEKELRRQESSIVYSLGAGGSSCHKSNPLDLFLDPSGLPATTVSALPAAVQPVLPLRGGEGEGVGMNCHPSKSGSRRSLVCTSGVSMGASNHRSMDVGVAGMMSSSMGVGSFRQQPPPMKACLSCHQQIHRNAPICPLCKAKSRSRNPKKPKRKLEDRS